MNEPFGKVVVGVILIAGVFTAFLGWYPFPFSLAWPSLVLARVGLPHSWLVSAIILLGGVMWLGFWSRRNSWLRVVSGSAILPALYSMAAYLFIARAPVPLPPVTSYDSMPAQREEYLRAFDTGYRNGMVGITRSYCFGAEPETRGFYDGSYQGYTIWCRMLGRKVPNETKQVFESSAAIDGVKMETN